MNAELKKRVMEYMYEAYENSLCDKHFMREFIMGGSSFKGLENMTDEELIEDYGTMVSDDDELLAEIKADMAVVKMLTE